MEATATTPAKPDLNDLVVRPSPEQPLLELHKIAKVFHTDDVETRALSNVELAIAKGEFVSISGPSGSGKSTLLAILGLLDVPSEGEYRIDGQDTAKLDAVRRAAMRNKSIGFIFQAFNLIGNLDSKNGDAVMELLEQLHAKGATICMVTHNPDYANKATRIVHLFDGRVVEDRRG